MLRIAGVIAAALILAGAAAVAIGSYAWRRATARRLDLLADHARLRTGDASPSFRRADVAGLPAPVVRYFAFALAEGQRRIRTARIRWDGEMRLQPNAAWSPFTAEQRFTARPPGFVWDAAVRMIPALPVRVRDSYVGGEGQMLARVGGVATVVNEGGTREMAESALARWLGEAAWFPTALLPGEGVSWEAIDDSTARATVTDGPRRLSAEFHFAATGEILTMTAMRYRDVKGRGVLTPFVGRYERFERRRGVMIPTSAEVAWVLPEGPFAYWRGRPTQLDYDYEPTR